MENAEVNYIDLYVCAWSGLVIVYLFQAATVLQQSQPHVLHRNKIPKTLIAINNGQLIALFFFSFLDVGTYRTHIIVSPWPCGFPLAYYMESLWQCFYFCAKTHDIFFFSSNVEVFGLIGGKQVIGLTLGTRQHSSRCLVAGQLSFVQSMVFY